jgi:hypothetical protein
MKKRDLLAALAGAAAVLALAGSVAWAAIPGPEGLIQGCYTKVGGIVRVIDTAKNERCLGIEVPISWNQKGQQGPAGKDGANGQPGQPGTNGTNGVSVTNEPEPAGANCANGGSKFTATNGPTYACNGRDGRDGKDGADGISASANVAVGSIAVLLDLPAGTLTARCDNIRGFPNSSWNFNNTTGQSVYLFMTAGLGDPVDGGPFADEALLGTSSPASRFVSGPSSFRFDHVRLVPADTTAGAESLLDATITAHFSSDETSSCLFWVTAE